MTLQNPTPYVLHVNLLAVEEVSDQTAKIIVPNVALQLGPKDDTADLDVDQNFHSQFNDDIKWVSFLVKSFTDSFTTINHLFQPFFSAISFRKGNKLGFYIRVTPLELGDCKFKLRIKHDFVNTVIQSHNSGTDRQSQLSWITHQLSVNLGQVM